MVCPKQYVVHFLILATYCVPLEWPKRLIQHNVHGDRPKHFQYNVYSICRRQWMVEQKVDNAIQRIVVSSIFLTQLTRTSHETLPFINTSLFLLIIIFKSWIVNILDFGATKNEMNSVVAYTLSNKEIILKEMFDFEAAVEERKIFFNPCALRRKNTVKVLTSKSSDPIRNKEFEKRKYRFTQNVLTLSMWCTCKLFSCYKAGFIHTSRSLWRDQRLFLQ